MALNISMTTRMLREIVDAVLACELAKMSHPISGKEVEQAWKLHCDMPLVSTSPHYNLPLTSMCDEGAREGKGEKHTNWLNVICGPSL